MWGAGVSVSDLVDELGRRAQGVWGTQLVNSILHVQLERVRRRKWIVATIVIIFLIGGVASVVTAKTTYSSKAAPRRRLPESLTRTRMRSSRRVT